MSNETSARIEGESGMEFSAKQKVLAVYPNAECTWTSRGWRVIGLLDGAPVCLGKTKSGHVPEAEAWEDAASKLAVPLEPKVGESGLSDEQLCKQEWPDVYAAFLAEPEADRGWIIRHGRPSNWSPITCQRRETAVEAWADAVLEIKLKPDARARIEAKPEPLPNTRQEEQPNEFRDLLRMAASGQPMSGQQFTTLAELRSPESLLTLIAQVESLQSALRAQAQGAAQQAYRNIALSDQLERLAAPKAVDSKEEQEANPHPEDVKLHYQTLKLMNEALEATRDSKQSSAYRVAEFAVCMKPDPTEEQDYSECPYCGGKWIRKASITNCPMCETMIGRITPIAAPKVVDSKEEICRHCHKTFDSHPDPGLNCYSEGTFSTRWEPIVDLRSKVEEQKCEPCRGSGRHIAGSDCPNCNGTGKAKVEDPYICTDPECFGDCHPIRKPKVEEQDGEREPLRHPFSLRDTAIIEVSKLGIGDVEDVTAACDYPDNSDEAGCTSVCVGVMERALKAEAENKLLKAESVAPPSLPTNSPCCMCGQVMVFGQICTAWEGYCHPAPTQKLIDLLNASRAAAPVTLPTHQIVSSNDWGEGHQVELRCSCGRTFIGLGDEALASSRASFEAHLPEKEGK